MPRCGAAAAATVPSMAGSGDGAAAIDDEGVDKGFYCTKEEKETAAVVWDRPPRAVLVKAKEHVPMPTDGVSQVDLYRADGRLGWDGYCPGFVERVLETEGNHYDMFAWGYIDGITEKIAEACRILERAG
ncbi:thioesterase domain-containing protein [Colletotrichum tofieldiae]|nr:thioesterase domain-containing protein [Colletotrichum tofieldiae]